MRAQVAGAARQSGHAAIKRVKEHAKENQRARDGERAPAKKLAGLHGLGGVMDGREAAQQISQRQQRGQNLYAARDARVAQSSALFFLFCSWSGFKHKVFLIRALQSNQKKLVDVGQSFSQVVLN